MQYFIRTVVIAILMLCARQVSAQRYVVDPFMCDSVTLENIQIINGKEVVGIEAFNIARGDTVNVLRKVEAFPDYGVIKVDGKEYAISVMSSLCFIDETGIEDPWETLSADWRTPDGRLYSTLTPYLWIVVLVVGALLLLLIGQEVKPIKLMALIFVPVMIALACYLEVRGYTTLQIRMFWWCDNDVYGFWGSAFRVLPFGCVILSQLASFPLYGRLVTRDDAPLAELIPMGISFLITIPVIVVVGLVLAIFHVDDSVLQIIAGIIFLGIVGIGSMSTIVLNIKSYGFFKGLWLTIFGAIYIVGAMIAVLGFAIALWHLFLQMMVAILPWLIVAFYFFAAAHSGDTSSSEHSGNGQQKKEVKKTWSRTSNCYIGDDGHRYNSSGLRM